ncbi:MAG TPA: hypothetical protein VMV92_35365 [Streptosporangiaceae bacterium]|nr:hypothetical protein [Streptosporangiaceae bacterium]
MELTRVQRVLAFLGIVVVLGGTGAYLFIPGVRATLGQGHQGTSRPSASATAPRRSAAPPATVPATSPATPAPAGSAPGIYQWLPFSQADLAKAASVTQAFGAAYDTFSYTDTAGGYVARMQSLVTTELSATLARAYATPGVASQRTRQQQVSTARAVINSLRTFGSSSLTFVVTIDQTMHSKQGRSQVSGQYAVTVTNTGGDWLVSDIELSNAGNS